MKYLDELRRGGMSLTFSRSFYIFHGPRNFWDSLLDVYVTLLRIEVFRVVVSACCRVMCQVQCSLICLVLCPFIYSNYIMGTVKIFNWKLNVAFFISSFIPLSENLLGFDQSGCIGVLAGWLRATELKRQLAPVSKRIQYNLARASSLWSSFHQASIQER